MNPKVIADFMRDALIDQGFKRVDLAWTLAPDPECADVPAAFAVPWKEKAQGGNRYTDHFVGQVVAEQFAIQIVAPIDQIETRRTQVRDAIFGKRLPDRLFINEFVEGEVLALNRSIQWWVDVYQTQVDWRTPTA